MKVETIFNIILGIASLVTALGTIIKVLQATLKKWLDNNINKQITSFDNQINSFDILFCKTYLIDFLSDIENGVEKDEEQYKVAYEVFDHYTNDLKMNSYIHAKWERNIKK